MLSKQATTVDEVLEKYKEAEGITPAYERTLIFSWKDLVLLRDEVLKIQALIKLGQEFNRMYREVGSRYVAERIFAITYPERE